MLKALVPRPLCPGCAVGPLDAHAFRQTVAHIVDGVLTCRCRAGYTVEDGILELVRPALVDADRRRRFSAAYSAELKTIGIVLPSPAPDAEISAQVAQRAHFDWFADNDLQNYHAYQSTPFWVAEDALTFDAWRSRIDRGWLLDVGCGDGRSAWPLMSPGATIVGCDISSRLVRQATARAASAGVSDRACFIVADCDSLPFAGGSFEYVLTYGVLHHLPNPARTCREIQRVLVCRGTHFGLENNATIFRGAFDTLMRWRPLWVEKAGAEPLISERMLRDWLRDLPVRLRCATNVFLPPHLVNGAGHRFARMLLQVTDVVGRATPGLRTQGG